MRLFKSLVLLLALSAVGAGIVSYRAYTMAREPFRGYDEDEVFFTVERGATGIRIGESLEERGIIRDRRLFLLALRFRKDQKPVQAGGERVAGAPSAFHGAGEP